MAKQGLEGGRGRRPGVVREAKRGGPPRAFWLALGLVAVIGIGTLAFVASRPKTQVSRIDPSLPPLKAEGYVLGSPTAPVEVIEFADFECPACGQYATITEPDVRTNLVNTGKVRVRYMDLPLEMHRNTWDASLAAACANAQGKFWEMHDALFANQDRWNGEATSRPRGVIGDLAKGIGLDMTKYGACMDAETYRPQIQATLAEGTRRGVRSTPTFVFNGLMVANALPYDVFKKYVDDAIAQAPARGDSAKAAPAAGGTAKGAATATPTGAASGARP
jgi:protein-disulfide isomerase